MNKTLRQRVILDLLKHGPVANQEDLQRALRKRGLKVGQATLSRDIRDMRLAKTSDGYSLSQGESSSAPALPPVSRLVREFVLGLRPAQNLLVIKTSVGSAQPVAAAPPAEQVSPQLAAREEPAHYAAWLLFDQAMLMEGVPLQDPAVFVQRLNRMLSLSI